MTTLAAATRRAPATPARWTRTDTRRLTRLLGVVAALHVIGWGGLALITATGTTTLFGVGLAVTAYALGVRHAFDADHLAVIDGATRKLADNGRRPLSVGLWFSLGHSTVVFVMAALTAAGAHLAALAITKWTTTPSPAD